MMALTSLQCYVNIKIVCNFVQCEKYVSHNAFQTFFFWFWIKKLDRKQKIFLSQKLEWSQMENEIRVFFIETQYIFVLKKLSSDQKNG